ncbi:MAG: hypothetical protein HC820_02370 [Hydrococcus sp. RM1_1_31]|nr:hypothetical protein [Hydrococcus sp. RM1_1_31]
MRQDSIDVTVVSAENLPENIQDDFGLIGDIAVSTFARRSDLNRELKGSFKEDDIKKAEEDWKTLVQKPIQAFLKLKSKARS